MKTAFIVGDSQAGGAGAKLAERLKAEGYSVTRHWKDGGGGRDVAELAQEQVGQNFDLVVVFHGGDDVGTWKVHQQIPAWFPGAKIVWYGSSPATTIGNLGQAQAVFGKKVKSAGYWFTDGTAEAREARNQAAPGHLPAGVMYVDWRKLSLPNAVVQPSGVVFPVLKDGIHVTGETAAAAFAGANWPLDPSAGAGAGLQLSTGELVLLALLAWAVLR